VAVELEHSTPLILASASPRRADLLRLLGHPFQVFRPDVDEAIHPGELPVAAVRRLAKDKAAAGHRAFPEAIVVAADTLVAVDGEPIGKPVDSGDAERMLRRLSGRSHQVFTGFAVWGPRSPQPMVSAAETAVQFRTLGEAEIAGYAASAEALDKAGGYAIQGRAATFVRRVEGSYTNVVGLPMGELCELLAQVGLGTAW
jgi:septum formation protein